ncbi:MAG: signal peptidase II [Anaerolineae bacterium]|nr:signal peptidase II [Anaerolineae bacterium]
MSLKSRRWIFLFVLVAAVITVDQLSKRWIVSNLQIGERLQPIPALSSFFQLLRSRNTGAAFGFLSQAGDLFLVISLIVVVVMIYYYPRIADNGRLSRIATGLICGGALGNAIDRLTYGHVVDFIHYQIPNLISNVSNLADHAIVLGVILLFIESWRSERARATAEEATAGTNDSMTAEDSKTGTP